MLDSNKIIEKAGQIYSELKIAANEENVGSVRYYDTKPGLKSNQLKAAIIAICEELNKQNRYNAWYDEAPIIK